jgi:outer membrane protein assembly factor BamB
LCACALALASGAAAVETRLPAFAARETGAWPQYGCDAGCRFSTPGSLDFPLNVKWAFIKAQPVKSIASFVVQNDRVILACIGDHNRSDKNGDPANNPYLLALDTDAGLKAWEWTPKHNWALGCPLAIARSKVFCNDDGIGNVDWRTGIPEANYKASEDSWGSLNVDADAGSIIKSCVTKEDNAGTHIEALTMDGKHRWTALVDDAEKGKDEMTFCSIAQGAGKVFVSVAWKGPTAKKHKDGIYALSQKDGSLAWGSEGTWGGVSFDGRYAYAVSFDAGKKDAAKLQCLDPGDGTCIWSVNLAGEAHHPPAHGRGMCLVLTDAGALLAFPSEGARAGKALAWQVKMEPPFTEVERGCRHAALAIAEGTGKDGAVVIANGKAVRCLDLKRGSLLADLPWDPRLGAARNPAIADGKLYVHGADGIACYATVAPAKKR